MSLEQFFVTSVNPNDTCGGGGCACNPGKVSDCSPPFAVFPGNEMDNPLSPHVVVCIKCMEAAVDSAKLEVLAAGEVDGSAEDVVEEPTHPATEEELQGFRNILGPIGVPQV